MVTKQTARREAVSSYRREFLSERRKNQELLREVEDLREKNRTLEQERLIDPKTKLFNRRGFEKSVSSTLQKIRRKNRRGKNSGVIIEIDIDNFKSVNDTFGNSVGDELILFVAVFLAKIFREGSDFIARKHQDTGDEFLIFLPEVGETEAYNALAERRKEFERLVLNRYPKFRKLNISFSFGVAVCGEALEKTIGGAHDAMQTDKKIRKMAR